MPECSFTGDILKNHYEFQLVGKLHAFKSYLSLQTDSIVIIVTAFHKFHFYNSKWFAQ